MSVKIEYEGLECPTCKEALHWYQQDNDKEPESAFACSNGHRFAEAPKPKAVGVSDEPMPGLPGSVTEAQIKELRDAERLSGISVAMEDIPETIPYQGIDRSDIQQREDLMRDTVAVDPAGLRDRDYAGDKVEVQGGVGAGLQLEIAATPAEVKPSGDVVVSIIIQERNAIDLRAMAEMQGMSFEAWVQQEFQRCLDNDWIGR